MAHPTNRYSTRAHRAEELESSSEVLRWAAGCRHGADACEAELLAAACAWADIHPAESIEEAATWYAGGHGDTGLAIAGPGAALVTEFCLPEFAAVLGMSTDAGRDLLGDALELRDRLPRLWARVQAVEVPAWRARRVARRTTTLPLEGARWVDGQVTPFAEKIGPAQLDRLLGEALARYAPAQAEEQAARAAEARHADVHFDETGQSPQTLGGTVEVSATVGLADALDLEDALRRGAAQLADCGSDESLDVRRSVALGDLARLQLTLDFTDADSPGSEATPGQSTRQAAHVVKIYVHLSEAAITGSTGTSNSATGASNGRDGDRLGLVRVEEHHQTLTAAAFKRQLQTWADRADLRIQVAPVIDLNAHVSVHAYEIPDRLRTQVILRDHTCCFPWCSRPARRADLDHIDAYAPTEDGGPPGQTNDANLAPLCRRHHRLKTFSAWTYTMIEPGVYLWRSPHGHTWIRDHTGTRTT